MPTGLRVRLSAFLRGWAIPGRVLRVAAPVTVILLGVFIAAQAWGGVAAAFGVGMGVVPMTRPALTLRPLKAAGYAVMCAMAGAVAVGLRAEPLPAAFFLALCCLVVAPVDASSERLMFGLPTAATILVSTGEHLDPAVTAVWMLIGGLVLIALVAVFRLHSPPAVPADSHRVVVHAIAMAVSVGIVTYVSLAFHIPHGYWIALTLTVVLRGVAEETQRRVRQRVAGTVGGVLIALLLVDLLPRWAVLVALACSLMLMTCYATLDDYTKQVIFLTPTIVLMGPPGSASLFVAQRAIATVIAVVLAAGLALAIDQIAARSRPAPVNG